MHKTVQTQWIQVPSQDGQSFDAYLALPPAGQGPGLVLLQEIFGVNAHIRAVAEQYAQAGFVVLAPDVFWRQQRRAELGYEGADFDTALSLMRALEMPACLDDIECCASALRQRPEVKGRGLGIFGYCMGGRLAYLSAAHHPDSYAAAIAYYGGGIQDQLKVVGQLRCPTLFHYGELDHGIPPEAVAKVRAAVTPVGGTVQVYPADHGFNCTDRPMYHPASAALALGRSLQFFAQNLF